MMVSQQAFDISDLVEHRQLYERDLTDCVDDKGSIGDRNSFVIEK